MINIHKGDHSSKVPRYVMDISDIIVNDFVAAVAKYIRYTDKYFLEIRVISRKKTLCYIPLREEVGVL